MSASIEPQGKGGKRSLTAIRVTQQSMGNTVVTSSGRDEDLLPARAQRYLDLLATCRT